jgi:hypothetical protein
MIGEEEQMVAEPPYLNEINYIACMEYTYRIYIPPT